MRWGTRTHMRRKRGARGCGGAGGEGRREGGEMRRKRGQAVREGVEKEIITFNTSF